jgi:citrate lyase synthetase
MVMHAFVLATDKAAIRFYLRLESVAQGIRHLSKNSVSTYCAIKQSELAFTIYIV